MGNSEGVRLIGDGGGALAGPPRSDWETADEPCGAWKGNYASCGRLPTGVRSRNGMAAVDARSGFQRAAADIPGAREAAWKCPVSALPDS